MKRGRSAMHNSCEEPGKQRYSRKLRKNDKAGLHQHHAEAGQPGSGDESGSGVQSLQRISPAQRTGVSFAAGIYTQEVIATVKEKKRLDIKGQIQTPPWHSK